MQGKIWEAQNVLASPPESSWSCFPHPSNSHQYLPCLICSLRAWDTFHRVVRAPAHAAANPSMQCSPSGHSLMEDSKSPLNPNTFPCLVPLCWSQPLQILRPRKSGRGALFEQHFFFKKRKPKSVSRRRKEISCSSQSTQRSWGERKVPARGAEGPLIVFPQVVMTIPDPGHGPPSLQPHPLLFPTLGP